MTAWAVRLGQPLAADNVELPTLNYFWRATYPGCQCPPPREFKNRRERCSRQSNEVELSSEPKSASLRRRLRFLNSSECSRAGGCPDARPLFRSSSLSGGQFVPRWAGASRTGGLACLKSSASEMSRLVPLPQWPESHEHDATLRGRRSCAHDWHSAHLPRQRGIHALERTSKRLKSR